uniref:Uncharacterized protein n=1 Tax=Cacopsylla melanoneura TaxID=428564 RepID=A0A8D9FJT8_9HEMI
MIFILITSNRPMYIQNHHSVEAEMCKITKCQMENAKCTWKTRLKLYFLKPVHAAGAVYGIHCTHARACVLFQKQLCVGLTQCSFIVEGPPFYIVLHRYR